MPKKTKVKENNKKITRLIVPAILIVSAITLIYSIIDLKVLPLKYLFPIIILITVITLLMTLWLNKSKGKFSKVIGVLLSIAMIVSMTQISKIGNLIDNATGADSKLHTINVIVMKDSKYESMKDLKDSVATFGANLESDSKNINNAIDQIKAKEKITVEAESYDDYFDLIEDLYDGKIDVILLNKAFVPIVSEFKKDFEEDTRVIGTYEYAEKIINEKGPVDVSKDTFSIYVSGIDTYGSISSVSRSDVNMIVTVNPVTNQILLTSIPRDYHVRLNMNGKKDKLTHAGLFGVDESMRTLEDLLNGEVDGDETIDIDYFLRVNFSSVTKIVDALGGVTVNSNFNFTAGGNQFVKGPNKVNGQEALAFTRERYQLPNGDNDRVKNQQALITGVLNKIMSPAIITNFNGFLSSIDGAFEFSMDDTNLNKLLKKQIDSMPSWEIIPIQLLGTGARSTTTFAQPGRSTYVTEPNYESVRIAAELILKMENNEVITPLN